MNDTPTGIKLPSGKESRMEPRGNLTSEWLLKLAIVSAILLIVYVFWNAFISEDSIEVDSDFGKTAYEQDSKSASETSNDDSSGLSSSLEDIDESSSNIAPIQKPEMSELEKKQLSEAYEKYSELQDEHKEALAKDRQAKIARLQSNPFIFDTPIAEKKNSDDALRAGLANHLGQSSASPSVNEALAKIKQNNISAQRAAENANNLEALLAGGGGVPGVGGAADGSDAAYAARLKEKEQFYNGKNRFAGELSEANFKGSNNLVWDTSTFIDLVLNQPIDTRNPGGVFASVGSDVYDSTGTYILIPAFSKVSGRYDSNLDYGNPTVQMVWEKIIFTESYCKRVHQKSFCSLPIKAIANDRQGQVGIRGRYNQRIASTIGYASLFSVVSVLPAWLIDQISTEEDNKISESDPDEIVCRTETTTNDSTQVNAVDDEVDTEEVNNSTSTVETCGPRSSFAGSGNTSTNLNLNNQENTDTRDLYEDIAENVYGKVDQRLDSVYQKLANRRAYARIPSGVKMIIYPSDDIEFPKGNYSQRGDRPIWLK